MSVKGVSVRSLLSHLEVDRAVLAGVLTRAWGACAGPVTALLIINKFSPELQGYFYTFNNLLALQVFIELGLGAVVIQFASHEWANLSLDNMGRVQGDVDSLSRLASLTRLVVKWYLVGGVLLVFLLGLGGSAFFAYNESGTITWLLPWLSLCLFSGATVCLLPFWSLLEGCNQVSKVYTFRLIIGFCSSLVIWCSIYFGAGLWAAALSTAAVNLLTLFFLGKHYTRFFSSLFKAQKASVLSWRHDILPMQWRIALSWISGYFVFSLFTPVLFHFQGPVVAGQFGMTWSLVGIIGAIATSWVTPKVPQFGMLIARRDFVQLDKLFWKITRVMLVVMIALAASCLGFVWILGIYYQPFASRLLPLTPLAIFLVAQVVALSTFPFSYYLRAHKKEPMMVLSVSAGILIGLSTFFLAKYYSVTAVATGYLVLNLLFAPFAFIIWNRCRKLWH